MNGSNLCRLLFGLAAASALFAVACSPVVIDSGEGTGNPNNPSNPSNPSAPDDPNEPVTPSEPRICGEELHLIGVYEANSDHSGDYHPGGEISVHVERNASSILVLSSYEPVHWTVTAAPGATLEKVILNGYYAQTADVPDGVEVETYDEAGSLGAYAYAWPSTTGGSDTQGLVAKVEGLTGRPLSSFNGCYRSTSFTIHGDLSVDSSCAVESGYTLSSHAEPELEICEVL